MGRLAVCPEHVAPMPSTTPPDASSVGRALLRRGNAATSFSRRHYAVRRAPFDCSPTARCARRRRRTPHVAAPPPLDFAVFSRSRRASHLTTNAVVPPRWLRRR